jgi:hypothetical protein
MNLACEEVLEDWEGEWVIPIQIVYPQPIGICEMWT